MQDNDHPLEHERATFTAGEEDAPGQPLDGDEATLIDRSGDTFAPARPQRARFRDRPRGRPGQPPPGDPSGSGDTATRPVGATLDPYAASDENTPTTRAARADATVTAARDRRRRGLFAAVLAAILLLFALSRLVGGSGSSSSAPPAPTLPPAPTPVPFVVVNGAPITATAVLGVDAKLKGPREAVELPDGHIAVADADNSRVAILDNKGALVSSITNAATAFQQPFALATRGHDLYVLDAARGAIDHFDTSGRFIRELMHDVVLLQYARGLALNKSGQLYVANPRSNAVVALSPDGKVVKQMTSSLGGGPTQYNQPSDIAVAPDFSLYIYDSSNTRIKKEKASGAFVTQWQAPTSDTVHSVHVLPLPDGRLLASDPGGALLIYPANGGTPTRLPLRVPGQPLSPVQPLGLSRLSNGDILVTDGIDNRLLIVTLS